MSLLHSKQSSSTGLAYLSNTPAKAPERLVLCIPGMGGPASDFLPLLEILVKQNPSLLYIAPDLPTKGDSPSSMSPNPTVSGFVQLLGKLRDEIGHSSTDTVVIGHSMGCRLALETFSQHSDQVSALVLIEGSWHGSEPPVIDTQALPPRDVQMQYILKTLETLFGPSTPEALKEEHRDRFKEADLDYLTQLTLANRRWDTGRMVEALQQVQNTHGTQHPVQLLLVQSMEGGGGPRTPLKKGDETSWMRLARENSGDAYTSIVIEDSGHWPHIDEADEVAQAILQSVLHR